MQGVAESVSALLFAYPYMPELIKVEIQYHCSPLTPHIQYALVTLRRDPTSSRAYLDFLNKFAEVEHRSAKRTRGADFTVRIQPTHYLSLEHH